MPAEGSVAVFVLYFVGGLLALAVIFVAALVVTEIVERRARSRER